MTWNRALRQQILFESPVFLVLTFPHVPYKRRVLYGPFCMLSYTDFQPRVRALPRRALCKTRICVYSTKTRFFFLSIINNKYLPKTIENDKIQ